MTYRTILEMMHALRRLRARERWTRSQIEAYQAQALADLRKDAYAHSPFYREFHANLAERPLQELPILTKSMLHDHFDEIVSDRAVRLADVTAHVQKVRGAERFLGRYIVNATSGTTGHASYILYNRAEWATVLASFSRFERHVGSIAGAIRRPRMAIVGSSTPWHISARIGATVHSALLPILRLDVGEPIDEIVGQLNEWQPDILASYASMAGILANEQASGRLQISPRRIVCAAEVLSTTLRQRIQAAWGEVVFNQYGASEGGTFAVECESPYADPHPSHPHTRGLHLFEDLFILEVVDHQNQPTPPGQYGDKVLLTVLFNHTQPLIRYELSDSVRMAAAPCSCGRSLALIDDVQGRDEEVLRFPGDEGGTVAVHPMVFYRILDATAIGSWQVVQQGGQLTLRLSGERQAIDEQALVNRLQRALTQQHIVLPSIDIQWVESGARGVTGKAARIRSRP